MLRCSVHALGTLKSGSMGSGFSWRRAYASNWYWLVLIEIVCQTGAGREGRGGDCCWLVGLQTEGLV
jgi:hypothetical protein